MKGFNLHGVIEEFETMTENAALVQRETLRSILDQNAEAEYLQRLGLGGRTDPDSFKSCVPVATHEELQPYIQRIIDGDGSPLLSGKPPLALSLSSGTTRGKSKYLPFSEEMLQSSMQIYRTSFAYINRDYPVENGKVLQFIYTSKQFKTRGGLVATTGTTNIYSSKEYKNTMKEIQPPMCSPDEVISSTDFEQSLYCHLLCGLIYSDEVQYVSSSFAYSIVHALRTFEHVWEEICSDIREGVLSSRITTPSVREAVTKILTPDRSLADTIRKKCLRLRLGNWHDLIPELWPNAKYVFAVMTGSMEPYVNKLRHYAGNLPLVSAYYGASEGWIGANVNAKSQPESSTYAVFPNIGYFEFIPLKRETAGRSGPGYTESEPVGLTEVEVGEEYEVVITNHGGLYRYRLGDVVKIAGFHNSTPELRFVCRRDLMPSINIDKNTEKDLQAAVEQAFGTEKVDLVDFAIHIDVSSDPGHYVVYVELSGGAGEDVLASCCDRLDGAFVDAGYVVSRKAGDIGPLELRIARRGTFREIMEHYMSNGATLSQYKTPHCVGPSNDKVLQILRANVVSRHFSTAYD